MPKNMKLTKHKLNLFLPDIVLQESLLLQKILGCESQQQ